MWLLIVFNLDDPLSTDDKAVTPLLGPPGSPMTTARSKPPTENAMIDPRLCQP